jgi:hypothetical protein
MALDIIQFDYKVDQGGALVTACDENMDDTIVLFAASSRLIAEDCADGLRAVLDAFRSCVSARQSEALRQAIAYAIAEERAHTRCAVHAKARAA